MVFSKFATAFVLATGLLAGSLSAQDHKIQLGVSGGLASPLAQLGQVGYPDGSGGLLYRKFKGGINAGANAAYWLDGNLGLRLDGIFATSKAIEPFRNPDNSIDRLHSTNWSKMFFNVDVMLRSNGDGGLTPFGYFGGGMAKMTESGGRKATRPTAHVGGGLNYTPANSALGFFGEAGLVIYDFDQTKFTFFDKVQEDLMVKVGVSFGF